MNIPETPVPTTPDNSQPQGKNRMTVLLSVFLLFASIANGITTLLDGLESKSTQAYISSALSIVLSVMYLTSLIIYRQGKYRRAAWITIIGIQFTMLLTISLYSGISIYSIGLQLFLTTLLALSIFSATQTTIAIAFVLIGGFSSILLDMDWPFPRATANAAMRGGMLATLILAGIFFVSFVARRFRDFSLYVKLLLAFSLIAVLPGATLGIISANTLSKALSTQANRNLTNAASQTATILDSFISSELTNIRAEASYPVFSEYIELIETGQSEDPDAEEEASAILLSLRRQDPVYIISYALLSSSGNNILDTTPENVGNQEYYYNYFFQPFNSGLPYVTSVITPGANGIPSIFFSSPVRNAYGETVGVLRVQFDASILQQLVGNQNNIAGERSFAVLVDDKHILLANGQDPFKLQLSITPLTATTLSQLINDRRLAYNSSGFTLTNYQLNVPDLENNLNEGNTNFTIVTSEFGITNGSGQTAAIAKMTTRPWTVVFLQPQTIFLNPIRNQIRNIVFIIIATIIIATIIGLANTRLITSPIEQLTAAAERIEQGDLTAETRINTRDEIGKLSTTFNNMTARLRDLVTGLEKRVAERTDALERRARQIQASADVGSVAARLRDIKTLLPQAANLIGQRFGFYHVGIFLLDEKREYAVLYATNSEGGQRMLARGHKLPVGKMGIVGYVTATGQARIALDTGQDAVFFDNPDLPDTHSEMAIPLSVGGRILGALDVQSTEESAFTDDDIISLKVLADQLSIAIENANLFAEAQNAADAARRAYGEVSFKDWQRLLRENRAEIGYSSYLEDQVVPTSGEMDPGFSEAIKTGQATLSGDGSTIYIPIKIRGNSIGAVQMDKPMGMGAWTSDDVTVASSLAEQLGTALESARLYGDASRRATRERLLGEISAKIGATIRVDNILKTAVEEVGRAFTDSEVVLQVSNFEEDKDHD